MRQNEQSKRGNQARPSDRATLAGRLSEVHPANIRQGLQILEEFADAQMRDAAFTAGHGGTHSEAEELAVTLQVVLRDRDAFDSILIDYIRLLSMVRTFLTRQGGNELAINQINRIEKALAVEDAAADPAPILRAGHWLKSKAVIVAALSLALLIWDISSDDLLLWQIIAALGLVGCIGGAAFRIGQRLQTPVLTSSAEVGKAPGNMVDRRS
jgi:hypothetical protein